MVCIVSFWIGENCHHCHKMSGEVVHTQANVPALAIEEIAPVAISLA
jgi:hypothetical protein